jgi:hypothetical protein
MSRRYRWLLLFWGALFLLSLLLTLAGLVTVRPFAGDVIDLGTQPPPNGEVDPQAPDPASSNAWLSLALAVVTTIASAGGFVITTVFGLREDRRETALHDLQLQQLRNEIERQQLEIERLKRVDEPSPRSPAADAGEPPD